MKVIVIAALLMSIALPSSSRAHEPLDAKLKAIAEQIKIDPQNAELLQKRIRIYRLLRNHNAITAELSRLEAEQPKIPWLDYEVAAEALNANALTKAEEAIDRFLKGSLTVADRFAAQLLRAKIRQEMGHFELASADYRAALAIDESVEAYLRSADLLERMGKLDDAAKVLHQGVKRMGGVTIRRSLIDVERARGHWEDALACLDKTMKQADIKTTWLLLRAEIRVEQHRPTDARRDRIHALDEANRLLRKRRSALALRDRARALMSLNRYEEAIHDLKAARKKSPTLIEIHQLLAKAKSLKGGSR